jgi:hypothetical protein
MHPPHSNGLYGYKFGYFAKGAKEIEAAFKY